MTTILDRHDRPAQPGPPREVSPRAAALAQRVLSSIDAFLHIEAASGVVLVVAAALALGLANSPWAGAYHHALETPVGVRVGDWRFEHDLHFWINDGLMTLFFFIVGLEIRREIHEGELSTIRRALVPALAAVGGMVAPVGLYLAVVGSDSAARAGWGVPMATDIAFAVGVLALLGKRVPPALRVLLLALAIIDDIGGILVIAAFYAGALNIMGFVAAAGGIAAIFVMQRLGMRRPAAYIAPALVVWGGVLVSGVHPTIAGVIVGLLTPAAAWLGADGMIDAARRSVGRVEHELATGDVGKIAPAHLAQEAHELDAARREALGPAVHLQIRLHPWVAFGIMPIFALANAGVTIGGEATFALSGVTAGILLGLVVGKPLGIIAACAIIRRLPGYALPRGIGWRHVVVLGLAAGIGFTMALFIAALAFTGAKLEQAKLAILVASGIAMALSLAAGRGLLASRQDPGTAATSAEAESSDTV